MEKEVTLETIVVIGESQLKIMLRDLIREELIVLHKCKDSGNVIVEEILTRTEMAKKLRISLVTLRDWVKRGLPVHRKRKRGRVLFIQSEVLQWLRENPELRYDDKLKDEVFTAF